MASAGPPTADAETVEELLLDLGGVLLAAGDSVSDIRDQVRLIAARYGFPDAQVSVMPTVMHVLRCPRAACAWQAAPAVGRPPRPGRRGARARRRHRRRRHRARRGAPPAGRVGVLVGATIVEWVRRQRGRDTVTGLVAPAADVSAPGPS